jgi:hypothetical protein
VQKLQYRHYLYSNYLRQEKKKEEGSQMKEVSEVQLLQLFESLIVGKLQLPNSQISTADMALIRKSSHHTSHQDV